MLINKRPHLIVYSTNIIEIRTNALIQIWSTKSFYNWFRGLRGWSWRTHRGSEYIILPSNLVSID